MLLVSYAGAWVTWLAVCGPDRFWCTCCAGAIFAASMLLPAGACLSEENVYLLCKRLGQRGVARQDLSDLYAVFISNALRKVFRPTQCPAAPCRFNPQPTLCPKALLSAG